MQIKAFKGLRPVPELAAKVASLPYDVVSTEEARDLASGNPLSMLHIVRAEIDFPEGTSPYSDAVYAKACENFDKLQSDGVLQRESEPCLFLYRQQMGEHQQRGVVAVCRVEDYDRGLIKKHEFTRADKEDDRTRLTSDMSANAGPVFLTYRGARILTPWSLKWKQDCPSMTLSPTTVFAILPGEFLVVMRWSKPLGLWTVFISQMVTIAQPARPE